MPLPHPHLDAFLADLGERLVWAQVLVCRVGSGFELRHQADEAAQPDALQLVPVEGLREWAQLTADRQFRPIKSAPNLRSGWRTVCDSADELATGLDRLYPGSIADWYAAQGTPPPVTNYREFTGRQTGMYRVTQKLDDPAAGRMISACCAAVFCLKRRLWTVSGLEPDPADTKSRIPCLEPCAVLLEFARKAMRIAQEPGIAVELAPAELETIEAALARETGRRDPDSREADFSRPDNPRRVTLLLEKLRALPRQRAAEDNE